MDWEQLVDAFNAGTLDASQWNHRMHIAVAIWHLLKYGSVAAGLCYLKPRLIGTNIRLGFENSTTKGYHETLTVFWADRLWEFIQEQDTRDFLEIIRRAVEEPKFFDKDFVMRYYTEAPWDSVEMRSRYHPPDITT